MGAIELGYHELAVELRSARGAVTTFDLDESPHAVPPLFVDHGIRSSVNALVGRPDAPFGILGAQTHQARSFTEDERDFLVGAASMLAQAIARVNERGDREAIQAQAEEAQRLEALGRLAGGIAHDFNNVLAVIRLQCAAIMRRSPDESTLEAMKQIDAAADRAGGVTRQLLVFGRSQILEPQVTDLNEVVEATVGLLGRFLGEDIETSCDLAPELDRTLVDRGQMTQVVLNLAVNARDAMDRGGLLSFRTRNVEVTTAAPSADLPPGRYVCLEVRDTGVGMTAETQRRVFEPFFTTKSTGTGLGLSTVYGIVEQSGGTIALESTPWVGTTFTIHFPVTDEQPFVPPPTGDVSTYGDELILLVEDEETLRAMTATELSAHGYRVLQAANASEALAIARERIGEIRLLVTDVIMPGLSGRELADRLVPQSGGTMKVLYVSGYADDAVLRAGVSRHHTAFVQKPYLPEDLARRVRSLLDA